MPYLFLGKANCQKLGIKAIYFLANIVVVLDIRLVNLF